MDGECGKGGAAMAPLGISSRALDPPLLFGNSSVSGPKDRYGWALDTDSITEKKKLDSAGEDKNPVTIPAVPLPPTQGICQD